MSPSAAPVFAALGDELRLNLILKLARGGPMPLGKLADGEGVTRQAVAKHLAVLLRTGLAKARRRGREQIWAVEPSKLREAERYLEQISTQWDDALGRLRSFVEEEVQS